MRWVYTYGMTMTRTEKASHHLELTIATQNSGYVTAEWARPTERRSRIAENGHAMMTAGEYKIHRMGRKVSSRDRRDVAEARMRARRRVR